MVPEAPTDEKAVAALPLLAALPSVAIMVVALKLSHFANNSGAPSARAVRGCGSSMPASKTNVSASPIHFRFFRINDCIPVFHAP
ncbi:hypothetical protein [Paenibacillus sp. UNC496MF]|uniref:hypothetical protein n=1 Tax=Paenibacillus sp. UNC496MF TaxID=1502753 RepID=UPI0015A6A5CC|nr:hypothetical protein [Paenibacillus sp. UNC496MF]